MPGLNTPAKGSIMVVSDDPSPPEMFLGVCGLAHSGLARSRSTCRLTPAWTPSYWCSSRGHARNRIRA
jgi:hypothetical protein